MAMVWTGKVLDRARRRRENIGCQGGDSGEGVVEGYGRTWYWIILVNRFLKSRIIEIYMLKSKD